MNQMLINVSTRRFKRSVRLHKWGDPPDCYSLARDKAFGGLCQSNGRSSARGATRPPSSEIQAARARHSANAAERLCL